MLSAGAPFLFEGPQPSFFLVGGDFLRFIDAQLILVSSNVGFKWSGIQLEKKGVFLDNLAVREVDFFDVTADAGADLDSFIRRQPAVEFLGIGQRPRLGVQHTDFRRLGSRRGWFGAATCQGHGERQQHSNQNRVVQSHKVIPFLKQGDCFGNFSYTRQRE